MLSVSRLFDVIGTKNEMERIWKEGRKEGRSRGLFGVLLRHLPVEIVEYQKPQPG
jgi:hypothetical protein